MTKKQLKADTKKKVKALIRQSLNPSKIDEMVETLFRSGCIDTDSPDYDTHYWGLAKNIVCAISEKLYEDYKVFPSSPSYRGFKKTVRNMVRFI